MKRIYSFLIFWALATSLCAQSLKAPKGTPTVYFTLTDSTVVSGKIIRQDSATIAVQRPGNYVTYLQPNQIVRTTTTRPARQANPTKITSFSLRDGATVSGQVVRQTPVAVVVRQANGTQSYIDPADILSTSTMATEAPLSGPKAIASDAIGAPYLLSGRTAYTPGAGTVYYRNTYLIRNEAEVGITNGWSAGIITNPSWDFVYETSSYLSEAIYTNTDFGTQVYTRIGVPIGNSVRLGAVLTAQLQNVPVYIARLQTFDTETKGSLLGQVLASFGKPQSNVTLGYAFRLDDSSIRVQQAGRITIGTIQRLSPRLALVSDNAIAVRRDFSGPIARLSAALRIKGNFHAFDLGITSHVISNAFYNYYMYGPSYYSFYLTYKAYPYIGYTVQLGGRR